VLGVSVNIPAAALRRMIGEHIRSAADLLQVSSPVRDDEIDVTDGHVGPGYGIPTPESLSAVRQGAREGLLFDPVYTGKAWAALAHAVRRGDIPRLATVVFLHTGGAPNVFLHADAIAGAGAGASTAAPTPSTSERRD
jgi:1-aminocyclopropane-1-carboxylate deaminase/D-cysteine desulfhydrase-like pyridoxal-dependent ACC family enzyme